jgi:hypothetical protein
MGTANSIAPQSTLGLVCAVALLFAVAPFVAHVSPVRPNDVQYSYRSGCPVTPAQLRLVRLSFWGFDRKRHLGSLVVNRKVTGDVVTVFRRLYAARFPLRRLEPVSAFHGSDDASMAADNTSGFNCRRAVGSATGGWSAHAYGLAIDVNPIENPYVLRRRVLPPAGKRYLDRAHGRPGMAVEGSALVNAFESVGWKWGGRWARFPDYQHFSSTGR